MGEIAAFALWVGKKIADWVMSRISVALVAGVAAVGGAWELLSPYLSTGVDAWGAYVSPVIVCVNAWVPVGYGLRALAVYYAFCGVCIGIKWALYGGTKA